MFCAIPPLQWHRLPAVVLPESKVQDLGVSLFFTTPVALFVLLDVRRWWRDGFRRWWMLASIAVIAGLLCYQSTGWRQPGFHRFTLDFLLPWLVVMAPGCVSARRTWIVAAMLAWSVAYFQATCQLKLPWPVAG